MKIGEALSLRAKQAQKLNDLRGRIKGNAVTQEGTASPEDVGTLIEECIKVSNDHRDLLVRIATANANTIVNEAGESLLSLLHQREDMIRRRNIYGLAAVAASPSQDSYRYLRTELKFVPNVNVPECRRTEEELDEAVRALDAKIQAINWATDL